MKKIACLVIELDENANVEEVIEAIMKSYDFGKCEVSNIAPKADWRAKLQNILYRLGETKSNEGYRAMFALMECVANEPKYQERIKLKELYAYVTEKTGMSYSRIERNVRSMIERIYSEMTPEHVNEVLGIPKDSIINMSNKNFISIFVENLF